MRMPFILLDDARREVEGTTPSAMRVYRGPVEVFTASTGAEVAAALEQAEQARARGNHIAGYLAYEAGLAMEPRLAPRLAETGEDQPLFWLAAFPGYDEVAPADVPAWLREHSDDSAGPPHLSSLHPAIERDTYEAAFGKVQEAIRAGDIYQANLTFPLDGTWAGDPLAIYAALRERAGAGYGGYIFDGTRHHLSFSPELFFALQGRTVTLKPMKGTRPRGASVEEDARLTAELRESEKDRAENLMITDLMRNDVSRLAVPGSVTVREPFAIERYPTVLQMVSTVRAELRGGPELRGRQGAFDLLRAIFPCGSITGAPKIRAMEIIDEIEGNARGIYCGAIGRVDADGDAGFNVAIRTMTLNHCPDGKSAQGTARMGVGSGLVADSTLNDEWAECLVKGKFVNGAGSDMRLIETMAFDPLVGVPLIEFHLSRLKQSATDLGFTLDRHALRNQIQAFCFMNREPRKLRVLAAPDGTWEIEGSEPPAPMTADDAPVHVALTPLPVPPGDWRLRYKTTNRAFYDEAREASPASEVVFERADGQITEGSFTNVFVKRGGVLLTPPASVGLLPGVLRASLIEDGKAQEAELTRADLADGFYIGNALRGLIPARLTELD